MASAHGAVLAGIFLGCGVFFGGDWLIDGEQRRRRAKGRRRSPGGRCCARNRARDGAGRDHGVDRDRPDAGRSRGGRGEVGAAYLVAVFVSSRPEVISSTAGLAASRWSRARILWVWIGFAIVSGRSRQVRS